MWNIAAPLILSMRHTPSCSFLTVFLRVSASVAIQATFARSVLAHTLSVFSKLWQDYAGTFSAHYHGRPRAGTMRARHVQGGSGCFGFWPLIMLLTPLVCGLCDKRTRAGCVAAEHFFPDSDGGGVPCR